MAHRQSIRRKITIGFISILIIVLLLGGGSYFSLHHTSGGFRKYLSLSQDAECISSFSVLYLNSRVELQNIVGSSYTTSTGAFNDLISKTENMLSNAEENCSNKRQLEVIKILKDEFEIYQKNSALLIDVSDHIRTELNLGGVITPYNKLYLLDIFEWAEQTKQARLADDIRELMLTFTDFRVIANTYHVSREVQHLNDLRTEFKQISGMLGMISRIPMDTPVSEQVEQFKTRVAVLRNTLDTLGGLEAQKVDYETVLDSQHRRLIETITATRAEIIQRQNTLGSEQRELMKLVSTAIAIAVGVLLVFGTGLAVFIIRLVTRPVRALVKSVSDISRGEGDLVQRVHLSSRDELGLLGTHVKIGRAHV